MTDRGRHSGGKSMKGKGTVHSGSRRRQGKKPLSTGRKILIGICGFLLALVLLAITAFAYVMSKMDMLGKDFGGNDMLDPSQLNISDEIEYDETGYLNVALFGLDTRENDIEMGTRSDTIIIASLNRQTKAVKLISVFRDTMMRQDDGSYNKANAAYSFGEEREAIAMLNRNLDMNIQHYVTVDFSAMVDIVDALGGIPIDVQQSEIDYINGYGTSVSENTGVEKIPVLFAGPQYLNGVQATSYARIRQVATLSGLNDDYGRAERQRTVLMEIAKRAQEASLTQLNSIIDRVFPKVKTNFSILEILAYAKDVKKYELVEMTGFPFDLTTKQLDVGDTVIPTTMESNVIQLHRTLYGEDGYSPSSTVKSISSEIEYLTGVGYVEPVVPDYTNGDESTWTDDNSDWNNDWGDGDYTEPDAGGDYTEPIDPDYTGGDGGTDWNNEGYTEPDTGGDYADPGSGDNYVDYETGYFE